jgi:hypothetical protein
MLTIMLSCIDAACGHQSCGRLSGENSPVFPTQTLSRPPGRTHQRDSGRMTVDEDDIKTYSLTEVANMVLSSDMKARERWLSQRLNRGDLSGYRVGRTWPMTRDDVATDRTPPLPTRAAIHR